jgi:hypothetical protein
MKVCSEWLSLDFGSGTGCRNVVSPFGSAGVPMSRSTLSHVPVCQLGAVNGCDGAMVDEGMQTFTTVGRQAPRLGRRGRRVSLASFWVCEAWKHQHDTTNAM